LEWEELVPQDDGIHTYISLKFPLHDSAGVPYAVCGIATDITERKRAEDAVEEERRRLATLVDASPAGILVADAGGRVLVVNREAERILGLTSEPDDRLERYEQAAVYQRPDGSVYRPEELPLQRALREGEIVQAEEIIFELPDGRNVPTLVNAAPVYSATDQIVGAIAVIQDITPLEEIERLRSEFLGLVSHELKTPLTAIKGSAAMALGAHEPLDAVQAQELFQIIDEQADRLRDMVDNLLDMTRIEAGSLSINLAAMDMRSVIEEVQTTFVRNGGPQELKLSIQDDLPAVKADRRRITQVLSNLLSNASKLSPPTAPINIEMQQDATQVTIHVRDHGRGIPKEKLPHLFKKFSRIHEDAGRELSGTGLGLAICKGIVEAHGGRIWAESPGEGQGATFSFTLPVAETSAALPSEPARRAAHLGKVSRAGERTRILAVDDEPQILRYLQRSLDEAGYQPITTSDPSSVVELVELEEPDLILLDLMLPGTDGFALLRRIREFSGVPVVFLTASDKEEDTVRALKMGADDYITKPFSPSELLARIEAVLRRRLLPDVLEARAPYVLDNLTINFAERGVTIGNQTVSLSATEYKLLYELAIHAGRVLTHDQILQRVWGQEYSGETALLRSSIRNLRRRLGDDARHPRFILTEPQVGYRMPKPRS
jgi:PAS domain S-box-containing protein